MFDEDFKKFQDIYECRKYWNGLQLDTMKKALGCQTDNALSYWLSCSRQYLCQVRAGLRCLSFSYIKNVYEYFDGATLIFLDKCFTMAHMCSFYFDKKPT